MDQNRKLVLAVYSLYTNEAEHTYLQYTAICALIFYLSQKKYVKYPLDELLVYDYKEQRRYIWEAKQFMRDINIIRDHGYLMRARSRSKTSRDVNAHQCTTKGHTYLENLLKESSSEFTSAYEKVRRELICANGKPKKVVLEDNGPELVCPSQRTPIKDFLQDFDSVQPLDPKHSEPDYSPYFL